MRTRCDADGVTDERTPDGSPAAMLARCGLTATGEPPEVRLQVLGSTVPVVVHADHVHPDDGRLVLETHVAVASPPVATELREASLHAAGDTVLFAEGDVLRGRRTLVAPTPGALFDALHELARAVARWAPAPVPVAAPAPAPPTPVAAPVDAGPYWCFVDRRTEVRAAPGSPEVVALLVPGTWYQASHDDGTWVHVRHPSGAEGVVPSQAVVRS